MDYCNLGKTNVTVPVMGVGTMLWLPNKKLTEEFNGMFLGEVLGYEKEVALDEGGGMVSPTEPPPNHALHFINSEPTFNTEL